MSVEPPTLDELRGLMQTQGVEPSDADLEAVLGFLGTILPQLEEIERRLPYDAAPVTR